jgi:hypothetical protein
MDTTTGGAARPTVIAERDQPSRRPDRVMASLVGYDDFEAVFFINS